MITKKTFIKVHMLNIQSAEIEEFESGLDLAELPNVGLNFNH